MSYDLAQLISRLLGLDFGLWGFWLIWLARFVIAATAFVGGLTVFAMFAVWLERKVAGHMQSRLGPMHVGLFHGWAQSIADSAKLLLKEDLIPRGADHLLFRLAPYVAFVPVFAAFMALPFGPQLVFEERLNIGVLYLLAVLAVEVLGVILAGWSSNNKWSVFGAMREACQMVSYEIPLGLAILCGVLTAGTLHVMELSYLQGGGIWTWFVFHNPFVFAAFAIYFVASLASNKRAPFDLPESESELVAGFHTEYSGLRFSFFFLAEYASMFVVGGIQAALFLGGWNSPAGPYDPVYALVAHYDPLHAAAQYFSGALAEARGIQETAAAMGVSVPGLIVVNLYGMAWFLAKIMAVVFVQIWLRWTLPRIRIDQVLHACVKVLLPLSLATLVGAAAWICLVPQPAAFTIHRDGALAALFGAREQVVRLGHLLSPTPVLQVITQGILAAIGVAVVAAVVLVVGWAWVSRRRHPRQSLFAGVLPVSRDVHFTRTP